MPTRRTCKLPPPMRLPNKSPAPDLDQLKKDKSGDYALCLFETAVITCLRYDDAGELLAWIEAPRGKRLTEREALNAILQKLLCATLSESAALSETYSPRQCESEADAESFIASLCDEATVSAAFPRMREARRPFHDLLSQCAAIVRRTLPISGRPATKHIQTVKALTHHEYLGTHWPKLANMFCDCGQPNHGKGCVSKLKSAVQKLKDLMEENQVELHKQGQDEDLA